MEDRVRNEIDHVRQSESIKRIDQTLSDLCGRMRATEAKTDSILVGISEMHQSIQMMHTQILDRVASESAKNSEALSAKIKQCRESQELLNTARFVHAPDTSTIVKYTILAIVFMVFPAMLFAAHQSGMSLDQIIDVFGGLIGK